MNRVKKEEKKNPRKKIPKSKEKVSWEKEQEALEPFANYKPRTVLKKGR